MPRLTFDDVFLAEKGAVVDKILELKRQLKVQSIVLTHLMMKDGTRTVEVDRKPFIAQLEKEGLEEPVVMKFTADGEHVSLTIGNNDDDDEEGDDDSTDTWDQ